MPIFLITEKCDAREEKEALSHGIDAVFEKDSELKSIVMNARAACGFTERDADPNHLKLTSSGHACKAQIAQV